MAEHNRQPLFPKGERDKAIREAQRQRAAAPFHYSPDQRRINRRSTIAITVVLGTAVILRARFSKRKTDNTPD